MANAVLWNDRTPQYCKNLVNKFLQFNDNFSYNTVSGGDEGVASNNQERAYEGDKSLLVTFTGTGEFKFNSGGTETQIEIPKDGQYLFSYAFWKDNNDATIDVGLQFYVNGVASPDNLLEQSLHSDNGFVNGQWNTYYQFLSLNEGDLITLDWTVQTDDFSGTKLYMDGLMYNLNDRNLTIPPIYQKPEPTIIEVEAVIDLGSIASNSSIEYEVIMQGVIVTDFITIAYPIQLIDLGLCVAVPTVSEPNKIKFLVHNHSGGAINPESGSYKFLAYRQ
jgi:hypothetical protein